MRSDLVQEVRINPNYTQYFYSQFDEGKKEVGDPKIVKRTMFTNDYLRKLGSQAVISMLPPNCRFIERTGKGGYMVAIEEPPAMRTITVHKGFEGERHELQSQGKWKKYGLDGYNCGVRDHSFSLAFPYVIFLMVFDQSLYLQEGMVFLRNQQLLGMSDYLLKAPLNNISSDQRICFGEHANKGDRTSLNHVVQNVIMVFWSAIFNTDYTYNEAAYKKIGSVFGNMLAWNYYSNFNPMFIYDADWIRMKRSFGDYISYTKSRDHVGGTYNGMNYKDVTNTIFMPEDTGMDIKITPRGRRKARLFYDIANGINIGQYYLHQGDPFQYKNGDIAYIDSFVGFQDGGQIKLIRVDKNGKKILMKLTTKLKNYIAASNKSLRYASEVVLPINNIKVKNEDILIIKDKVGEFYGKIDFIRQGRDGSTEIKIGSDYYLADQIDATLFDMKEPEIDGVKLEKGKQYLIISDQRGPSVLSNGSISKYEGVSVRSGTNIRFDFIDDQFRKMIGSNKRSLELRKPQKVPRIYDVDQVRAFDGIFRMGRGIHCMTSGDMTRKMQSAAWELPDGNGVAYHNSLRLDRPKADAMKKLVKDDRFFLPGVHYDIDFSIGDKVIAVDWSNPANMLKIKEIAGFSFVDTSIKRPDLYFILSDREGNLSKQRYLMGYQSVCKIGSVRKITNTFNGVSAGTKIISDTAGVHGFPKKDVNIIIGFITDTGGGDPLVLCSNCQTLWFSDMMKNFKRVTMKSQKWKTLNHAPIDLSKIKPQAGDIINGTSNYKSNDGYLMCYTDTYKNVRAGMLQYYTGYPEAYGMDRQFSKEYIYDCIPNPRLSPSQIKDCGEIAGFSNFHGLFFTSPKSGTRFINEPGRIVNVSSSVK